MASGKPVISTVKMGYSIIKKYECGIEIDECTPKALADAILRIYNMPREEYERLGANAAQGAKDFDFEFLTNKLLKVINHVLAGYIPKKWKRVICHD
jgi:glycosyltransferase involved in cell wall biosynthesis